MVGQRRAARTMAGSPQALQYFLFENVMEWNKVRCNGGLTSTCSFSRSRQITYRVSKLHKLHIWVSMLFHSVQLSAKKVKSFCTKWIRCLFKSPRLYIFFRCSIIIIIIIIMQNVIRRFSTYFTPASCIMFYSVVCSGLFFYRSAIKRKEMRSFAHDLVSTCLWRKSSFIWEYEINIRKFCFCFIDVPTDHAFISFHGFEQQTSFMQNYPNTINGFIRAAKQICKTF